MKKIEQQKADAKLVPIKQVKQNTVEGTGSVWNNNSYHWEQKSVDKWAEETLKKCLSLWQFKHERATLRVTEVKDLKGDSSISIRKQKKIVTFDYNIKLVWECEMGDESNTKAIGKIGGEYVLPEVSNDILDDGEEWEVECSIKSGDEGLKKTLYQMVKKWAPENLRKTIKVNFVDELKKK